LKSETYQTPVDIPADKMMLKGNLVIPYKAKGIVAFAHGSGSSRHSPRNKYVAEVLQNAGLATLLFDLLTLDEEYMDTSTGELRFDINLLAQRLIETTDWLRGNDPTCKLKVGYFGASTGAAAALVAAAERCDIVSAVVSRGGRADLAEKYLKKVKAPTLLIVGSLDYIVMDLNQLALKQLTSEKQMTLIQGATHLFEESGALEKVAKISTEWFLKYIN
jgi:putative phosphoribosyl transferase